MEHELRRQTKKGARHGGAGRGRAGQGGARRAGTRQRVRCIKSQRPTPFYFPSQRLAQKERFFVRLPHYHPWSRGPCGPGGRSGWSRPGWAAGGLAVDRHRDPRYRRGQGVAGRAGVARAVSANRYIRTSFWRPGPPGPPGPPHASECECACCLTRYDSSRAPERPRHAASPPHRLAALPNGPNGPNGPAPLGPHPRNYTIPIPHVRRAATRGDAADFPTHQLFSMLARLVAALSYIKKIETPN